MLKDKNKQLSIYTILYNRIPENHMLKLINDAVDFGPIVKILEKHYNKYYGRPAKDPEIMIKLLILKYLYGLSDERVIEESLVNLAYMWFLGISPDEELPDPSLLTKFRKYKLQEITLDEIIIETVRQCVEKGIIKDIGISIDSTHTEANTFKLTPERLMKKLAKKIFKKLEEETGNIPEIINQKIPEYKKIKDYKEAKKVMEKYLKEEIEKVENIVNSKDHPETYRTMENAKEILKDPKFMEQRGIRSIVDQDARVGHKSKTNKFFGYKTEYMITTKERIITAVTVKDGAYVDGTNFKSLMELTEQTGLKIEEVYGDKAYFKKEILDKISEIEAHAYIPVSEMAYKINEELYSYNKDSDEWFCSEGNKTFKKTRRKKKDDKDSYKYHFEKDKCRNCSKRIECKLGRAVGKILEVGINTSEFYEYSQEQKTDFFKEKYKNRSCQEWKNGEMKNFHGLNRAKGYGLSSMSTQAKLTALAVNLKRIASILSSKKAKFSDVFLLKLRFTENF